MTHVANHAYNGPPLQFAKPQSLSDGILLLPKRAGHGLIDDHNKGMILVIGGIETSTALHGNPNRFEIARTDRAVIRRVEHARRFGWTAFDIKRPGIVRASQGQIS